MTRSGKPSDEGFDFDIPTTPEDNEALWKAHRDSMKMSMKAFLEMCRREYKPKRTDLNSDTDEPFTLVDD